MNPQQLSKIKDLSLPQSVADVLKELLRAAHAAFNDDLRSVVLFGSAAEGKLRLTSDVNLLFILRRFTAEQVNPFRDSLRLAHAAARVSVMLLLESELPLAVEAFAVKFADISRRRRVLHGEDLLATVAPSREALIRSTQQMLINLSLRLRERYALVSLREEHLVMVIAESAAPLRAAAATILELEGQPAASPKEALESIVGRMPDSKWSDHLQHLSQARQTRSLPAGTAGPTLLGLIELAGALRNRVEALI